MFTKKKLFSKPQAISSDHVTFISLTFPPAAHLTHFTPEMSFLTSSFTDPGNNNVIYHEMK